MSDYEPEAYWSRVGDAIAQRAHTSYVAGDDNAYYRYKRAKFLKRFLRTIDFKDRSVLEIGVGPGGNLLEIAACSSARKLIGVDIAQSMIQIAADNLARQGVSAELHKIDGAHVPLADRSVDVSYTVTVLHHNTDGSALRALIGEICRVTKDSVVAIEDTGGGGLDGAGSYIARRVVVYTSLFGDFGFELQHCSYLNTKVSYLLNRVVSRVFRSKQRAEGQPFDRLADALLAMLLPGARLLDHVFVEKQGLTKMVFIRKAEGL